MSYRFVLDGEKTDNVRVSLVDITPQNLTILIVKSYKTRVFIQATKPEHTFVSKISLIDEKYFEFLRV